MEWFIFAAPVPGSVDVSLTSGTALVTMLVVALTPVVLAVRHALSDDAAAPETPQLRVIEGRKELRRRAA